MTESLNKLIALLKQQVRSRVLTFSLLQKYFLLLLLLPPNNPHNSLLSPLVTQKDCSAAPVSPRFAHLRWAFRASAYLSQLLWAIYRQMQYDPDFAFDGSDEEDSEEMEVWNEIMLALSLLSRSSFSSLAAFSSLVLLFLLLLCPPPSLPPCVCVCLSPSFSVIPAALFATARGLR